MRRVGGGDVRRRARRRTRAVPPVEASQPAGQPDAPRAAGRQVEVARRSRRARCGRPAAATARAGRPPGRAPRRSCGRAGRWPPATRRCPCRGSGGASGCAGRPRGRPRARPRRARRRSARPEAEAPTTRTPPGGELAGVAVAVRGEHTSTSGGAPGRGRHVRRAVRPGGDDDVAGAPGAAVGDDPVARAGRSPGSSRLDRRAADDGRVERGGVPLEVADELGRR